MLVDKEKEVEEVTEEQIIKSFRFFGFSIWRILAYFIIYSVIGYFVETIFCIAIYGVWESRQSFLYGPFCAIYGIGAIVIIVSLQYFKKNYNTLFFGGCIVGSILEYVVSWLGEVFLNVKWWDYSDLPLNLNGRICLLYAIFWGAMSLYLMVSLNPKVDKFLDWAKGKLEISSAKRIVAIIMILLLIDFLITAYAIVCFMARTIVNYNIDVSHKDRIEQIYNDVYSDAEKSKFIYKYFGDEKMLKTFPRLKVTDSNNEILYFSDFLTDIQPYYRKIKDNVRFN